MALAWRVVQLFVINLQRSHKLLLGMYQETLDIEDILRTIEIYA